MAAQAASAAAWIGVAWFAARLLLQGGSPPQGSRECPRCHGTGLEDCSCTRWSDGDVGCSSCVPFAKGKTTCRACGGGGTAVPIEAKVRLERERDLRDFQARQGR